MKTFNVRVYGLLFNEKKEVLVTDEFINGVKITKFPGGGLEFGEGTIECVIREFMEELGWKVEVINHFYTTDFFQISAFNENKQIISIYYSLKLIDKSKELPIRFTETKFDFNEGIKDDQVFRWLSINADLTDDLTFPIDKRVGEMLLENRHLSFD
jgi:8-oxo-dGTP pyrophosphatase MutT (NUDIX family)